MSEVKKYLIQKTPYGTIMEAHAMGDWVQLSDYDAALAREASETLRANEAERREAALREENNRLKNIDHRQILAESAAKYLLDSGAENFIGDVFTIEADDGVAKFEVIVTTQKVGAKSPGELCNDFQQRLTDAEKRVAELDSAAREMLRIAGIANQGSNAYNRAIINLHSTLNLAEGEGS